MTSDSKNGIQETKIDKFDLLIERVEQLEKRLTEKDNQIDLKICFKKRNY